MYLNDASSMYSYLLVFAEKKSRYQGKIIEARNTNTAAAICGIRNLAN